ncbi:MAG: class I SAM-dependent methyltransferase, partial [Myxococcota bacterium]
MRRQHPSAWANAVFVDLGCGERPWTTVESAARFREVWPGLPVVGVEIHPGRVAAAQAWSDGTRTRFVEGGFELGAVGHRVRLLRAMNVLRQYRPEDVAKAHAQMGARLVEGGLLVEGTCDKH